MFLISDFKETDKSVKALIEKLIGDARDALKSKTIAQGNWDRINAEPVKELKTPVFLAMAFPTVFMGGLCGFYTKID